jgi:uncharacterized protein with LGFP repeats
MRTFRVWRPLVLAVLAMVSVVVFPSVALAASGPDRIQAAWLKSGGAEGPVGASTADAVCDGPDSGCMQTFAHATYYNSFHTNSFYVMADSIGAAYDADGGPGGRLGYPVGLAACPTVEVGCRQFFAGGEIAYSAATGAHAVLIHSATDGIGLEGYFGWPWTTTLGYPTGDLSCTLTRGGCTQQFQHGASYQPPTPGVYGHFMFDGPIRDYWLGAGAQDGPLGYPWSDTTCDPSGQCFERFEHGDIVAYSAATGVHAISGLIAGKWWWDSVTENVLIPSAGLPIADVVCVATDDCTQEFQHATLVSPAVGGVVAVVGAIRDKWKALGGAPVMGEPFQAQTCGLAGGGCSQYFWRGTAYWSAASGAHFVSPIISPAWLAVKGASGTLGYPIGDQVCGLLKGGCYQRFQGGIEYWSGQSGAHFVRGPIATAWAARSGERGALGYPTSNPFCGLVCAGCGQHFQNGSIYWSATSGTHAVRGAIRAEYAALGWENNLGYPTSEEFCGLVGGGCGQHFQNGSIYWSPRSGAHDVRGGIRTAWAASGWERGRFGYPTGERTPVAGGRFTQTFQHGRLTA